MKHSMSMRNAIPLYEYKRRSSPGLPYPLERLSKRQLVTLIMRDIKGRHRQDGHLYFDLAVAAHRELTRREKEGCEDA